MFGTRPLTPNSAGITGPININAVIAHLVEMTPPQRKQFAQMHMDDPMLLSAAKFVDSQISKQAAAQAAQQMGAAPPPVNQQVVAQMAPQPPVPQAAPQPQAALQQAAPQVQPMPEESGIAQLSAPNMPSEYAAGGIVAFGDGGPTTASGQDTPLYNPLFKQWMRALNESPSYQRYREMVEHPYTYGYAGQSGPHPRNKPPIAEPPAAPAAAPATSAGAGQGRRGAPSAPPEKTDAAPEKKQGIDQLRADKVGGVSQTQAAPDYASTYSNILKAQGNPRDNLPPEIAEIGDLARAQRDKAMALADKQSEGLNALVSARQARQDARERNIAEQEAINPWMAMITGGLGIAQSKGKGLSGLAEGAQLGVNQYMLEAKYTNAQRQKLEDARDALQDLKYNAETMTNKDRLAAENSLTQGLMAVKDATVKHIQHKEDVDQRTAGHIFDAGVQQSLETQRQQFQARENALERQNRAAIASASAAAQERIAKMPGAQERLFATLGGGDAKKGFAFYTQAAAENKGDEALLAALVKDPMLLGSLPPDLQSMVTNTLRARLVPPTVKAPPASQVRAP